MNPFLGETITLEFVTQNTAGTPTNADSTPAIAIHENGTALSYVPTAANVTTGLYKVPVACTSGNGFEDGKSYSAYVTLAIGGVSLNAIIDSWQMRVGPVGGAYTITLTVTDGTNPLQSVAYGIYDGTTLIGSGSTDASGNGTISADAGTFTVALVKGGYTFTPTTRTVTGNQTGTLVNDLAMTASTPPSPSAPDMCVVTGTLLDGEGNAIEGAAGTMALHIGEGFARPLVAGGNVLTVEKVDFTTNASGAVKASDGTSALEVVRTDMVTDANGNDPSAYWIIVWADAGLKKPGKSTTIAAATFDLSDLI